mgnify:CR=1 FL=1
MDHERHENHEIIYKDECYAIQGAVFEVYREMGHGFLEAVYQECLLTELQSRNIPCAAQPMLRLLYKNQLLEQVYIPDFVCYGKIIVELKAVKVIAAEDTSQVINYLRATDMKLGLLVNFGSYPKATINRVVL